MFRTLDWKLDPNDPEHLKVIHMLDRTSRSINEYFFPHASFEVFELKCMSALDKLKETLLTKIKNLLFKDEQII